MKNFELKNGIPNDDFGIEYFDENIFQKMLDEETNLKWKNKNNETLLDLACRFQQPIESIKKLTNHDVKLSSFNNLVNCSYPNSFEFLIQIFNEQFNKELKGMIKDYKNEPFKKNAQGKDIIDLLEEYELKDYLKPIFYNDYNDNEDSFKNMIISKKVRKSKNFKQLKKQFPNFNKLYCFFLEEIIWNIKNFQDEKFFISTIKNLLSYKNKKTFLPNINYNLCYRGLVFDNKLTNRLFNELPFESKTDILLYNSLSYNSLSEFTKILKELKNNFKDKKLTLKTYLLTLSNLIQYKLIRERQNPNLKIDIIKQLLKNFPFDRLDFEFSCLNQDAKKHIKTLTKSQKEIFKKYLKIMFKTKNEKDLIVLTRNILKESSHNFLLDFIYLSKYLNYDMCYLGQNRILDDIIYNDSLGNLGVNLDFYNFYFYNKLNFKNSRHFIGLKLSQFEKKLIDKIPYLFKKSKEYGVSVLIINKKENSGWLIYYSDINDFFGTPITLLIRKGSNNLKRLTNLCNKKNINIIEKEIPYNYIYNTKKIKDFPYIPEHSYKLIAEILSQVFKRMGVDY